MGVHRHFELQMFMEKTEFRTLKVLFALLFMCSVQILYAINFDVEGIYYNGNESSKTATVVGSYNDVVHIPEKVEYNGIEYLVTAISNYAFNDCKGLTEITIPNSVTTIGEGAFTGCTSLTEIIIPNSVTTIGNGIFQHCENLTKAIVGNGITSISFGTFGFCSNLTEVTLSDNVVSIESCAFNYCTSLAKFTIPNSVTFVGQSAFQGCSSLTEVIIGNSVMTIDAFTFYECSSLTEITIPNNVASIGAYVFGQCNNLEKIIVEKDNPNYDSRENCNAIISTKDNVLIVGCKNTRILNSVTSIGSYAFAGCTGLIKMTIPSSVTSIGYSAFRECANLTEVVIPNSVTSIDGMAFENCRSLPSVTIPNSVTSIGDGAFNGCRGLTSVTIADGVDTLNFSPFNSSVFFSGCPIKELYLGRNVKNAKGSGYSFVSSSLETLVIGNNVTFIDKYAFSRCSNLTSLFIPNSVTSIGDNAFSGCSSLTSVIISNSVTSIGADAFSRCSSLTEMTIPSSVTSIGCPLFNGCSELASVIFSDGSGVLEFTANGYYPFSIDCPIKEIYLGRSTNTNVKDCFRFENAPLATLVIGSKVKSIASRAFLGCNDLTSITSYINSPFPISYVFDDVVHNNAILYVPSPSLWLYNTTEGWNNFKNIIPIGGMLSSVALTVTDEQNNDITEKVNIIWYNEDGNQIGTGSRLSGIADSTEVYYSVLLDETLGRIYREIKMQKATTNEETITCRLEKIGRVTLEGRVSATDIDKVAVTVGIKQMLNGKYEENFSTQTNEQGVFRVEVFDDESDITISGEGYLNATLHRDGFSGNGNVGTIPMNLISGFSIAANVTLQKAVSIGETSEETTWNDGLNNIEFTLTNTTRNTQITDFTVQNGNLIIKSGADAGDDISLTAKSKQGIFADAATTFTLAEGANTFNLQLTELGGLDATCEVSNNGGTTGYLYDSNDVLVAKGSYIGETLAMRHLPNGVYTLVSMGRSLLLGNMTRLADMAAVGLSEGKDYVATRVKVVDGYLTAVNVSEVPRLDETQFYYTTGNTYFNANKSSVTVGNYLTLSAHVDFKAEHTGKINAVTLTVDLPEDCQMVENSVIANHEPVAHTMNGNRMTMALNKEQWQSEVRFCIIPTLNQIHTITAMALFDVDGQVHQPIGTAQFEAKGLSLNTPKNTVDTSITISGTAIGHSEISIYDNDVLIGKATSKADGSWTTQCELYKPYSHSFHDIYAKIITKDGLELMSEMQHVEYDKYSLVPEKVTMSYYNGLHNKNIDVEFNLLEGVATPSSYPFYTATDFTFLADFTRNDTTLIKDVNIKVLNSDGTVRTLPAMFDGKQNRWVASTRYSSANKLPRNVAVEYDFFPADVSDEEREESILDQATILVNNANKIYQYYMDDVEMTVLEDSDDAILLDCKFDDTTSALLRIENMDYVEAQRMMEEVQFIYAETDEGISATYTTESEDENEITVVAVNLTDCTSFRITMAFEPISAMYATRLSLPRGGNGTNFITGAAGVILDFAVVGPYLSVGSDFDYMTNSAARQAEAFGKKRSVVVQKILEKCPDGSFRLSDTQQRSFDEVRKDLATKDGQYIQQYYEYINEYQKRLKNSVVTDAVTLGAGKVLKIATETKWFRRGGVNKWFKSHFLPTRTRLATSASILSNTLGVVFTGIAAGAEKVLGYADFTSVRDEMLSWSSKEYMSISIGYADLQSSIEKAYKNCEQQKEDEEQEEKNDEIIDEKTEDKSDFNGNGSTPNIDPSGYVYEAVTSNRLEGVTATCYQMVQSEDMYGDVTEEAVIWNAEDYSQQNPLKTDATGFYRWDVPQGMWQVKYEKEGYETAYSEWLPVPPPQLDVNIGMKQSTPPTVKQMRGFESGITIEMAKYMRPETMTEPNITVTRNSTAEKGSIELLNAEKAPLGDETYASKVKFVPQTRFNTTDVVVVTVHKEVESYCSVKMETDHVETVKIESEITDIVAVSVITIPYQGEKELRVQVLPNDASAGKTLHAVSSSPIIASVNVPEVTIDENGIATLIVSGELPGGAVLDFTVDGTDVKATSKIRVVITNTNAVATPVASVPSGETISDTDLLTLSSATEGATIYYTLDGSCPCDEQNRIKYVGPITLPVGQVTLQAIAVREGMEDSDVAAYEYTVKSASGLDAVKDSHHIETYYQDGCIVISGAKGASCRIYDLQGYELASRNRLDAVSRIKLPKMDVYVVNVLFGDGQTVVCKVMAK